MCAVLVVIFEGYVLAEKKISEFEIQQTQIDKLKLEIRRMQEQLERLKDTYVKRGGKLEDLGEAEETIEAPEALPPEAFNQLKEGELTTFENGQTWTLMDGKARRLK